MSDKIKTILKVILFTGIGILLLWLIIKDLSSKDIQEIKQAFSRANYGFVLLSLLIGAISHVFRALRWNQLMEPIGVKAPLRNTFLAVVAGYMANLAIPRLGEFSRCALLHRYNQAPLEATIGTVITERIIDTLTLLLFLLIVLITQFNLYGQYVLNFVHPFLNKLPLLKNPILYLLLLALFIGFYFIYRKVFKQKNTVPQKKTHRVIILFQKFFNGISSVTRVKNKGLLIFNSVAIWLFYLATTYVNFWALPETSALGINAALAILVWGAFGFILTQGGLGAYQLIAMQVFALYGINTNIGFALGWIIWTAQTLVILVFGTMAFLLFPILNKPKK
jgi:hypothetical protein